MIQVQIGDWKKQTRRTKQKGRDHITDNDSFPTEFRAPNPTAARTEFCHQLESLKEGPEPSEEFAALIPA